MAISSTARDSPQESNFSCYRTHHHRRRRRRRRLSSIRPVGLLRFRIFLKLMNLFTQLVGFLGWGIGPTQGLYLHSTTQHRETRTHTHTWSGIRTHDPSVRAAENNTCIRPPGRWGQPIESFLLVYLEANILRCTVKYAQLPLYKTLLQYPQSVISILPHIWTY
jgi:hypothetical protein